MGKLHLSKWWGLYALVPLMIGLMVVDVDGVMSQTWHRILLAGIAFVICALALSWVDNNPRLVERAGLGLRDDPAAPRLYTIVEDEWESVPIRHSGIDNGFEEADD